VLRVILRALVKVPAQQNVPFVLSQLRTRVTR
jgi:hypothetical protein